MEASIPRQMLQIKSVQRKDGGIKKKAKHPSYAYINSVCGSRLHFNFTVVLLANVLYDSHARKFIPAHYSYGLNCPPAPPQTVAQSVTVVCVCGFDNTDEKSGVQQSFLVTVVVVVADGGDVSPGSCFYLPAPEKGPGYWTSSLLGPTLWISWDDSEAALYAWISRFLLRSPTPLPACSLG